MSGERCDSIIPLRGGARTWLGYAAALALLSVLYFGSLGELLYDTHDEDYLADSAAVSEDFSTLFSPDKRMPGRPTLELALWLGYVLWGDDPQLFHLMGVLLHLCASLGLARSCRYLGMNLDLSLATGALFLVDVAHFRAVHWISAFCYPLVMIFFSLALIGYLRFVREGDYRWLAATYIAMLAGLLAHVTAIATLAAIAYFAWRRGQPVFRIIRFLGPLGLLMLVIALVIKQIYTSAPQLMWLADRVDPLGILQNFLGFWARLFTAAHWLPMKIYHLYSWELFLGGLLFASFLFSIWKRIPILVDANVWIVLNLLPFFFLQPKVAYTIPGGPSRYLYLASAGSSAVIAFGLYRLSLFIGAGKGRIAVPLFSVLLLLVFASSFVFAKRAEAVSNHTSGRSYIAGEKIDTGIARLKLAIEQDRGVIDREDAYVRLCMVADIAELDRYLGEGLALFPQNRLLTAFRLVIASLIPGKGHGEGTLTELRELVESGVDAVTIGTFYYNAGRHFGEKGGYSTAVKAYEYSLIFWPDRVRTLRAYGVSLISLGRTEEAEEILLRAVDLAPDDYQALYAAALAMRSNGRLTEAIELCRRGLALRQWEGFQLLLSTCRKELSEQGKENSRLDGKGR